LIANAAVRSQNARVPFHTLPPGFTSCTLRPQLPLSTSEPSDNIRLTASECNGQSGFRRSAPPATTGDARSLSLEESESLRSLLRPMSPTFFRPGPLVAKVLFLPRRKLALEAAALRQQLAVFKRKQPGPNWTASIGCSDSCSDSSGRAGPKP
jgi:hypothetical protein